MKTKEKKWILEEAHLPDWETTNELLDQGFEPFAVLKKQ